MMRKRSCYVYNSTEASELFQESKYMKSISMMIIFMKKDKHLKKKTLLAF